MRMRPLIDHRYWVEGAELRLTPAGKVPAGTKSWVYDEVIVSEDLYCAFLRQAAKAGVADTTIAAIKQEQYL